jgi:hypothetical protein
MQATTEIITDLVARISDLGNATVPIVVQQFNNGLDAK